VKRLRKTALMFSLSLLVAGSTFSMMTFAWFVNRSTLSMGIEDFIDDFHSDWHPHRSIFRQPCFGLCPDYTL
jgi:hypothetical protein